MHILMKITTPDLTLQLLVHCSLVYLPGVGDWGPLGYLNQSSMDSLVESRRMCCSDATPATKVTTTLRYALIFNTRFSNPHCWPPLLHYLGLKPPTLLLVPPHMMTGWVNSPSLTNKAAHLFSALGHFIELLDFLQKYLIAFVWC